MIFLGIDGATIRVHAYARFGILHGAALFAFATDKADHHLPVPVQSGKRRLLVGFRTETTVLFHQIIEGQELVIVGLFLAVGKMTLDALTVGHGGQQIRGLENQSVAALAPANDHDGLAGFSVLQTIH